MSHLNITTLWISLFSLIILSSFFSIAETAYMSVNRYKLKHLSKASRSATMAKCAQLLLERPDRLLGVILLGDTFSDILASSISTVLAVHYFGATGILVVAFILTFIILVFGELAPKTLAALHPMPVVLYSAWPLWVLLKLIYPLVFVSNIFSNSLLFLFGVKSIKESHGNTHQFNVDELRFIITDSTRHISHNYQEMLLHLLDLEKINVEDIMIPQNEIKGIDITNPLSEIIAELKHCQHTRIVVYSETLDNILGFLHVRECLNLLAENDFTTSSLKEIIEDPYFIPEGTKLSVQLLQFCRQKVRIGLVVDEYGNILGLVTIEDILEEIVGEFTTDTASLINRDILPQKDGNYLIDGSVNLRVLNRTLGFHFPLDGPKTLSGLIIEYLEMIPPSHICLCIADYKLEILQVKDNMIKTVKLVRTQSS